jgi:glucose/arabinose dehydrogenase
MKSFLLFSLISFFCINVLGQSFADPNFTAIPISSGWNQPVGAAFNSNGQKLFVWERGGKLYVCNRDGSGNYIKQTQAVADISEEVADWDAHGMLGFALDPNFETNGLIYLLYVVDRHHLLNFGTPSYNPNTTITGQATIGRVTRYQTITSGSNLVINPSTRQILIGETRSTGMPILHHSHGIGTLAFAADGTLLVTIGDAASYEGIDAGSDAGTFYQQALTDGIIRPAENVGAFRSQMINSMSGKLLRINPQTGDGVPSNPFYSAAEPRAPKSRVWAFGIRNSFRIFIKPGTGSTDPAVGDIGEVYLGDVGFASWEEMNICKAPGTNFGWPIYEGNEYTIPLSGSVTYKDLNVENKDEPNPLFGTGGCTQQFLYFRQLIKQATVDDNKTIYNPCNTSVAIGTGNRYYHRRPILEWSHAHPWTRVGIFNGNTPAVAMIGSAESQVVGTPFPGQCSVGGTVYTGNNFPAQYKNTYFQADFGNSWIKRVTLDFTDVVTRVDDFASNFLEIVCITQNPIDGTLVTVQLGSPTGVKKIQYGGNQPPVAKLAANVTYGSSPLSVNFNGGNSYDPSPGGSIVSYTWNFGGGSPATSNVANPGNIVFTESSGNPKKFVVKLTVTDNGGATNTDSIIISVNNTPPVVNITSPIKNSLYKQGPDTLYACTATVTDAQHGPGQLTYEWQTILRHNNHEHREAIDNAVNTSTLIQRVGFYGSDVYYWLIELKVTDAAGLSTKDSAKIFPDLSAGGDITPPLISSISPLSGATNVATGTMVAATFNEAIDPATVTGTTFQLRDAGNNLIPASVSTSSAQIILDPSSSLAGSTVYTATITSGASGVKDLAGNALASNYSWSFTTAAVDNTAPTVTSVSPANGATGVSTGTTVIANFSEAVNASSVTGTTFQLRDPGNNLVSATISTSSGQITLTPSDALTGTTVYTATITGGASGVKDLAGNALASNYSWSFTTAAVTTQPLTIQSFNTKTGTSATVHSLTGVPAGALLVLATTADAVVSNAIVSSSPSLTWTKRADAGAVNSDNAEIWTAVYAAGGAITVTSNWGGDNSQASVCYVVLNAEAVLVGASAIATLQAAPSVTITTTRENSIIFGCTADWKAVNGATRTLRDAATERLYFKDGNFTTYHYTKAAATIGAFTEGVSLPTGQQASTALLEIRSATVVVDNAPPTVISVTPANGTTGVAITTTATAVFDEAMNATTINNSTIELRNSSNALITSTFSYNAGTRTATLTPSAALANSTVYTVTIVGGASGVKDVAGNALANNYSWSFTTVAGDITPPTVTSVTPANGATGVAISTTATAIFNESMNATTINSSTIELRNPSNTLITAAVSYNAGTRTATLTPSVALANSTVYTAKVKSGTAGVKDVAGNALASDYNWSFTTVAADITPPTVTSVTPLNGATGVSVSTTVSAIFNEAMNATTINGSTIELRNASNTLITATVSYNAGTRTVTLTPSAALANSTVYAVTIIGGASGVKDVAGNALASDYNWSFTTVAADITAPTVSSVTPLNGATGVSVSTTVSAIFNEAMDATTINGSTIELRNSSNALITAAVSYNAGTRTATLTPSIALANSTVYTAKVKSGTAGVKDVAGNALASDYNWSFTTVAVTSQPPVSIQSFNTKTGTAATAHPLTGVPAGALLVLATTADAVVSNCSVSSSPSLTWTKRADAGATNSDNAEIWTAVYSAGGSITVTSNWGGDNSQSSVCYVVLNAEPVLSGASATAVSQSAPSVTITTTRENSIIFGCTADWKAVNGATRTLRDAATERFYFKDGNFTTYHYTKAAATITAYTEGVSLPTGQQASTALLEIRSAATATRPANPAITISNSTVYGNSLEQNYPNPFTKVTNIPFTISKAEKVNLVLFDISGRIVKVLVNASKDKGTHAVNFNAGSLAKGVYYYRIQAGEFTDVKKLTIW